MTFPGKGIILQPLTATNVTLKSLKVEDQLLRKNGTKQLFARTHSCARKIEWHIENQQKIKRIQAKVYFSFSLEE